MSAKRQTDAPFAEALSELKRERGLSFRELHEATQAADPTGRGISGAHISRLCNGLDPPSSGTVALIVELCVCRPDTSPSTASPRRARYSMSAVRAACARRCAS